MANAAYAGIAVASDGSSSGVTAVFGNVTLSSVADFFFTAIPAIQAVADVGGTAKYAIATNAINGFTGTVTFGATGLPPGAVPSFVPAGATSSESAELTIRVSDTTPTGTYLFWVTGTSGGVTRYLPLKLIVTAVGSGILPAGWANQDVGTDFAPETGTTYSNTFTLTTKNAGLSGTSDQFQYAYRSIAGNGTMIARLVSAPTGSLPRAGLMVRGGLSRTSPYVAILLQNSSAQSLFRYRTAVAGSPTSVTGATMGTPYWVKLVRTHNAAAGTSTITGFVSVDGATWIQTGSPTTIALPSLAYLGLVMATDNAGLATAKFDAITFVNENGPADFSIATSPGMASVTAG